MHTPTYPTPSKLSPQQNISSGNIFISKGRKSLLIKTTTGSLYAKDHEIESEKEIQHTGEKSDEF